MLVAGTARTDITPPDGIAHAGWGAQTHQRAEGVDFPLYCTVLYVTDENNSTDLAIIDIDTCIISVAQDRELRNKVATASGIAHDNLRVSYTHTHSGPVTGVSWIVEGADLIDPWLESIYEKAAIAVNEAKNNAKKVRVTTASGQCEINVNRRPQTEDGTRYTGRDWEGFVDHEVLVTAFDDEDGAPVATIVNYACHPTIMAQDNRLITPDYPGITRKVVEDNVGGMCLFLQGAAGNIGPIDGFTGDLAVYRKAGHRLGLEASRIRMGMDPIPRKERLVKIEPSGADLGLYVDEQSGEPDDTLSVSISHVTLPAKELPPPEQVRADFDSAQQRLEEVRKRTSDIEEIKKAAFPSKRAYIALNIAEVFGKGGSVELPVQVIRIGNTAFVALPVEPFAEIGVEVKAQSPADWTVFGGYSNGYYGYMPMSYAYPQGGYEVTTSPFAPGAGEQAIEACVQAIEDVWRKSL
jgi:neutral ceramidase